MRTTTLGTKSLKPVLETGWLSELPKKQRDRIIGLSHLVYYDKGEVIYHMGDMPDGLHGILEGSVQIFICGPENQPAIAELTGQGFWIGDLAMFSDQTRLVTVRCTVPCTVLHLPSSKMRVLTRNHPDMWQAFYKLSYINMRGALDLVADMQNQSPSDRVLRNLQRMSWQGRDNGLVDGWLNITQNELADVSGVSGPTVQRVLKTLVHSGQLELAYGKMRLVEPCDGIDIVTKIKAAAE